MMKTVVGDKSGFEIINDAILSIQIGQFSGHLQSSSLSYISLKNTNCIQIIDDFCNFLLEFVIIIFVEIPYLLFIFMIERKTVN